MAWKISVPILVLAMASSVLSLHPRFRFWLPTFDYQLETNQPTVYDNQHRPSDRPTVRRMYGTAGGRGAISLSRGSTSLPSNDVISPQLPSRRKGLERILQIRRLLEKIATKLPWPVDTLRPGTSD